MNRGEVERSGGKDTNVVNVGTGVEKRGKHPRFRLPLDVGANHKDLDLASLRRSKNGFGEHLHIGLLYDREDLRKHRLSDGADPLRHKAELLQDLATVEVGRRGVLERSGFVEGFHEDFGREAVEHGEGGWS